MSQDELAAHTQRQIERAQRAAEEARGRGKATRGGALRLPVDDDREAGAKPANDFPRYYSGD